MVNTREIAQEYRLSHWSEIMRERQDSGMSIRGYCKSIGLHENVYYYWQRRLREAASNESLPIINPPASGGSIVPNGWAVCGVTGHDVKKDSSLVVEVGKFKVAINYTEDIELFTRVCQALLPLC